MNDNVRAAIVAAINAYMQEEARITPSVMLTTFSPWKFSGLRELMKKRTSIQQRVRH